MIELHITMTGKGYSPKAAWECFANEVKRFEDIAAAKVWLAEHYGKCRRVPMYCDVKAGPDDPGFSRTVRAGTIYCFRNADWSHAPVEKWMQQDWVSVSECKDLNIAI